MRDDQRARGDNVAGVGDPRRTRDHQSDRLLDGRYRIGSRIARGGMASVYEAVDTRLDRTVAVKIMHPGLGDATSHDDDSFARRFVREARAAARLSHPNVVAVYDQGRDETGDGTVYLVMEYVPGHTLRDTITKEAPMSPERALAILDPVLSALALAHRAGLIHRDVKPENVLIADDGRIKVADFGLAKAVSSETQHTATNGVLIGTVSYLAPELVIEQKSDARADVYAAGVILFEMLTGTKPHTGESPIAVAYRHVHHDVPAPSSVIGGIPDYVDALVARATTRDPSLRPADASVLLHHVHRVTHALHNGVRSDPELVDDLLPSARVFESDDSSDVGTDTTPEPVSSLWDGQRARPEHAAPVRDAADGERTTVIGTPPPTRPGRPAAAPSVPHAQPQQAHQRRGRRGIVLALLVALLLAGLGAGGYWFGWGRYTSTPSVVTLDQVAAEAALDKAGLDASVGKEVYSESVDEGIVIATEPGPGERILPGDEVSLTVSLGKERYDIPDLAGLTLDQAEDALAEVKMVLTTAKEGFSDTVAKGQIIRTKPVFGTPAALQQPPNTTVTPLVSKGKRPITVRDWTGRDADEIEKALKKRGLLVEVTETEFSDDVDEGDIISQSPESGTVYKGDTIKFVVSKGPELIAIPKVRYLSTDDAVAKLEGLGFKVQKERASIYLSGQVAWATRPGDGSKAKKGSTIILFVV